MQTNLYSFLKINTQIFTLCIDDTITRKLCVRYFKEFVRLAQCRLLFVIVSDDCETVLQ